MSDVGLATRRRLRPSAPTERASYTLNRRLAEGIRRALDIAIALTALLITLPLLVLAALAVRIDSPGPVLFRQQRVGKGGKLFTLYKLRGMYVDAPMRWPELYSYIHDAGDLLTLRFHPEQDPRVTRVGRFIRRTSIDELPNFWNVLMGHMSIVGPRPEIPEMLQYYGDKADIILSVRPGVTSLPKVTGRDRLTVLETLDLDVWYVEHRSFWLDLKIMAATVATVVLQRGVLPG
jgi:lipopolysaccharide/colanic/teichoic acid biosynthesis glycosyltransferase